MNRVFIIISQMEHLILMILVILPGVLSEDWGVTFDDQCAIKGTTVVIKCKYDYPSDEMVTSVGWFKDQFVSGQTMLVSGFSLPSSPAKFKYVGNKRKDCSLEINNIQQTDEGAYFFSFVTTRNRWRSRRSAYLSVKELTALVQPSTVIEGDDVSLTCFSGCPTPITIAWFKDGKIVQKAVSNVRKEDAGKYYCAVLGQWTARSASVSLNVQYAPKKVTLSVSQSGNIVKGSSVTLTCNSDANPPVTQRGYSLYKDRQLIGSGQSHTISDIQPSHSGLYYCQASNNISWGGVDVINSTEVHMDVQYRPMNIVVSVVPPHEVLEGSSVNLTCNCAANPAADYYTWYRRTDFLSSSSLRQVGSGQVLSLLSVEASDIGRYLCQAGNSLGDNNSTEVLLAIKAKEYGIQPVPALAGVGVLFVTLVIALLLFWRKQRIQAEKKTVVDARLSERGSSSSDNKNQSENVYANIDSFPCTPPPVTAGQDITSASQRNSSHKHDVSTFYEDEVTYSTVNVKPRNPSLPHHIKNSKTPQNTRSKVGQDDDSVIYTSVAKSS